MESSQLGIYGRWIWEAASMIWFFALFSVSLKKCFWKGEKKKRSLVIRTIFTNPYVLYLLTMLIVLIGMLIVLTVLRILNVLDENAISAEAWHGVTTMTLFSGAVAIVYLILLFLIAWGMSKWLKARHPSLVIFLYLMFTVFMVLTMRSDVKELLSDHPIMQMLLNRAGDVAIYIGMVLFYFLIVKPLAELTERPFETSWRIFVIPPAVFCLVYATISMGFLISLNDGQLVIIDIFSILIMFLFIWAFYVIIKNINATGDAIKARDEVKTLSVEVMEALAHTIDAKDEYTKGHSVRVARYARMIAERLGLSPGECENIYYMGLLHDIGKIGVPNEIINSTSKLTKEEFDVIKTHPGVGYDILAEIKSRPDLSIGARWHHERFDGGGYPDGKPGEGIPLQARIIAVADSYDAMTSNRSYRHYMSQEKVRSEIEKNAGTQFDPRIAKVMLAIIDEDTEYSMHE